MREAGPGAPLQARAGGGVQGLVEQKAWGQALACAGDGHGRAELFPTPARPQVPNFCTSAGQTRPFKGALAGGARGRSPE